MKLRVGPLLFIVTALLAAPCLATAPQSPFAAGPIESVVDAVRKARRCGIKSVRFVEQKEERRASVFYDQQVSRVDEMCVMHWMTQHGAALKFEPRWFGDDFSKDWPVVP